MEDSTFSQKILTRNQPHKSLMAPWQYWLGRIKPKVSPEWPKMLQMGCCGILKIFIQWNFLLADCLNYIMSPDKCNSIMAKAMGLILSLIDITSARLIPFGMPMSSEHYSKPSHYFNIHTCNLHAIFTYTSSCPQAVLQKMNVYTSIKYGWLY